METSDRLAAYLADELDPADRGALDDELARDGQLRAALADMRRADAALTGLASPVPGDGFDTRMDGFVDDLLAELDATELRTDPQSGAMPIAAAPDDLVTSTTPATNGSRTGWMLAVAAAVVLLAGVGVATLQPFGGDDMATSDADLSSVGDQAGDAAVTESAEDSMEAAGPMALPIQPIIVDDDRALDDGQLDALLDEPVLADVAGAGLDREQGTDVGLELQRQLGQVSGAAEERDDAADGDQADEAAPETESSQVAPRPDAGLTTRSGDPVAEQLLADAQRCLGTLLEAGPTAIPVYVERASVGGQQALVFGLVTIDPQDDAFTRREVWTLERGTCQVLRFAQS